ncbi:hypothetical protein [Microbacterium sp. H83]|uniref:hypothetical protein n=1 Tax=Microbacterium sp. H83 TaxID=1827324 RepID=UPI0007F3DD3B|nr:hypothetical protein [Microbacterium sp. H83]OAN38368.1 hypothetical protein A4X16_02995 [Microbacterium sp. H83]
MSTSDQQEQGPLTRKQLREIRLTGATPVITPEEAAAAAAAAPAPPRPPAPEPTAPEAASEESVGEPTTSAEPASAAPTSGTAPLTRRQVRERERGATAPTVIPPVPETPSEAEHENDHAPESEATADAVLPAPAEVPVDEAEVVSVVPADDIDDADVEDQVAATPVSASATVESAGEVPMVLEQVDATEAETDAPDADAPGDDGSSDQDAAERPTVSSAFGRAVLADAEAAPQPITPSFDELLTAGDSAGSQHLAPNTLIFTPSPGDGSLSGPVASTGEILVTGSYELPNGLGSQGHAHGTTDGKDIDAVLIDGELPPASSPTPIAASAAVSTIKPAGEVIRPPAPEKGNKLMLILAIVAGGLALALGVALIVAFTTNVF